MDSNLHKGMSRKSPSAVDASMKPPSAKSTVNDETTRGSTQSNQKPLGPREA